jgi:hypothetical protein
MDQLVYLIEQRVRVEHHTVPDRAPNARVQDAARDLVQHDRLVADMYCVPRVGSALVSNDPIRALGEHVDQLSLPLVSPLRPDNDDGASPFTKHGWPG